MLSTLHWTRVLLFFLLGTLAVARVLRNELTSLPTQHDAFGLLPRQYDGAICLLACDLETCGSACPLERRREIVPLGHPDNPYKVFNQTTDDWSIVSGDEYNRFLSRRSLERRAFTVDYARWTKARAARYLSGQAQTPPTDNSFASSSGFTNTNGGPNEGTVSYQAEFATSGSFEWVANGLHGCTVLAVISNRGAYMAHYWETYTTNGNDNIAPGSPDLTNWQNKVLQSIDGVTGTRDANTLGPTIDWNLFDQPGDNTIILIMTPLTSDEKTKIWSRKYPQKTGLIQSMLMSHAGMGGSAIKYKDYQRLNYWKDPNTGMIDGPDKNNIGTSEKGIALLQYDGDNSVRLWMEELYYDGVTVQSLKRRGANVTDSSRVSSV